MVELTAYQISSPLRSSRSAILAVGCWLWSVAVNSKDASWPQIIVFNLKGFSFEQIGRPLAIE